LAVRIEAGQRKVVAVALLAALAGLSWITMDAGRPRELVLILLAGFALRIVLAGAGSRYHSTRTKREDAEAAEGEQGS
jgi:hypothetical protein